MDWIIILLTILLTAGTLLFALGTLVQILYKYLNNIISKLNN